MSLSGKEGEYLFCCQLHLLVKSGVLDAAVWNDLSSNYANITCKCACVCYCKQLFFLHFTLGHFGPSVKLPSLASTSCVVHFKRDMFFFVGVRSVTFDILCFIYSLNWQRTRMRITGWLRKCRLRFFLSPGFILS